MFGYININKSQLSEEERKAYQAYYMWSVPEVKDKLRSQGTGSVNL